MHPQRRHADGKPASDVEREARERRFGRWMFITLVPCGLLLILTVGTNPIPRGDRWVAKDYLERHFPNSSVAPSDVSSVYTAALFHLIRTAPDDVADDAIKFAAQERLGYASPYVIERLQSANGPELRQGAHAYLVTIAGVDYGQSPAAWRAWWRNPSRSILGLRIGQLTLEIGLLLMGILMPLNVWGLHRWAGKEPPDSASLALAGGFPFAWFFGFMVTAIHLVGGLEECTFAGEIIRYHTSGGDVLGLEDARLGGGEIFVLLLVIWLVVPFLAALALGAWGIYVTKLQKAMNIARQIDQEMSAEERQQMHREMEELWPEHWLSGGR